MVLFAHMLTHAVAGVISVMLLCRYYKVKLIPSFILYFLGGIAGILPDILGGRDSAPATHSLLFTPLFIIPIVIIAKLLHRPIPIYKYYIVYTISIWFGHLLFDTLDHEMPLFYPFTQLDVEFHIVRLGDPLLLSLLIITALLLLIRKWKVQYLLIPLVLCFIYLGVKVISKEQLRLYLSENYVISYETVVNIYPPHENLINTTNMFKWLQWGYDIYDEHRVVRALVPLVGTFDGGKHVDLFYPEPTSNRNLICHVEDEYRTEDGFQTLICNIDDEWFVYEYVNQWTRVEKEREQKILREVIEG